MTGRRINGVPQPDRHTKLGGKPISQPTGGGGSSKSGGSGFFVFPLPIELTLLFLVLFLGSGRFT